jgi:hypothetical protein
MEIGLDSQTLPEASQSFGSSRVGPASEPKHKARPDRNCDEFAPRRPMDVALIHVAVIVDFRSSSGGRLGFFGVEIGPIWGTKGPKPDKNRPRRSPNDTQRTTGSPEL